ncbi:MAG: hypothetical protein QOG62_456 [Thermoleophilaceae bacterium]|jgi:hypothetical protein|nr:hypothetical protein [Thermoleophilaceae bacterium]
MGKRGRKKSQEAPAKTVDYTDSDGNILTVREKLSLLSVGTLKASRTGGAAATVDDVWRRRTELLFERFVVSWTIFDLPLTNQKELLGRYRMADQDTQRWVRKTLDEHIRMHQPELAD